jgi:hypothetical protein
MLGKLATIVYFYNIESLLQYIDREVVKDLRIYLFHMNPNHYLCSTNLDAIFAQDEASKTEASQAAVSKTEAS